MIEELIITDDNINKYINKKYIYFKDNRLTILIKIRKLIINNKNVISLICYNCELEELDINNCINLQELECSYNKLQKLNINKLINLKKLICYNNPFNEVNMNNSILLQKIYCDTDKIDYFINY